MVRVSFTISGCSCSHRHCRRITCTSEPNTLKATEVVKTHSTEIAENECPDRLGHVFDITPHHPCYTSVDTFLEAISEDYRTIAREWNSDGEVPNDDMWKAYHLATIVNEQAVVTSDCWPRREEKLFAQNVPGKPAIPLLLQNSRLTGSCHSY